MRSGAFEAIGQITNDDQETRLIGESKPGTDTPDAITSEGEWLDVRTARVYKPPPKIRAHP